MFLIPLFYNLLSGKKEYLDETEIISRNIYDYDFLISIPHSGTLIPLELKENLNLNKQILIGTDLHTNKIANFKKGIRICSKLNPYVLNLGRAKNGIPEMKNHLARNPFQGRYLDGTNPYKKEFSEKQKQNLLRYYDLYHKFIEQQIINMKKVNNYALVVDIHSYNSIALSDTPDKGEKRRDFNIGTLDGKSTTKEVESKLTELFKKHLPENSLSLNHPYKGGYITIKYHNPKQNIHAIQIEINKKIYMHECLNQNSDLCFQPKPELKNISNKLEVIIAELSEYLKNKNN